MEFSQVWIGRRLCIGECLIAILLPVIDWSDSIEPYNMLDFYRIWVCMFGGKAYRTRFCEYAVREFRGS
ncbi:Uncharacterised protein [Legionella pneumophila]|nr:Uncharacterised protein [Legionella pneumophila]